jgi:pentatricopeptide repeat protein
VQRRPSFIHSRRRQCSRNERSAATAAASRERRDDADKAAAVSLPFALARDTRAPPPPASRCLQNLLLPSSSRSPFPPPPPARLSVHRSPPPHCPHRRPHPPQAARPSLPRLLSFPIHSSGSRIALFFAVPSADLRCAAQIMEEVEAARRRVRGGGLLNTIVMNAVLEACVRCGDVDRALRLFEEMRGPMGCGVDDVSYGILLKVCGFC